MAPDIPDPVLQPESKSENDQEVKLRLIKNDKTSKESTASTERRTEFKSEIRWPDLMAQIFIHAGFLYGGFYLITFKAKLYTYVWGK